MPKYRIENVYFLGCEHVVEAATEEDAIERDR